MGNVDVRTGLQIDVLFFIKRFKSKELLFRQLFTVCLQCFRLVIFFFFLGFIKELDFIFEFPFICIQFSIHFSCSFYCLSNISIKMYFCMFVRCISFFHFFSENEIQKKKMLPNEEERIKYKWLHSPFGLISLMTIINYNWNSDIFIKY